MTSDPNLRAGLHAAVVPGPAASPSVPEAFPDALPDALPGTAPSSEGPRVYAFEGLTPVIDPTAHVHPTAVLIGDVIVGAGCYVGPGVVMRGDFGRIELRRGANLQDNCVV